MGCLKDSYDLLAASEPPSQYVAGHRDSVCHSNCSGLEVYIPHVMASVLTASVSLGTRDGMARRMTVEWQYAASAVMLCLHVLR